MARSIISTMTFFPVLLSRKSGSTVSSSTSDAFVTLSLADMALFIFKMLLPERTIRPMIAITEILGISFFP